MLACKACEVTRPEQKLSAHKGDFSTTLNHLLAKLQRRIDYEHQQAVSEHEHQIQDAFESLRQENRELRARLHLPEKDVYQQASVPAFRSEAQPPTFWVRGGSPGVSSDRLVVENMTAGAARRRAREEDALRNPREPMSNALALPAALRNLADETDRALDLLVHSEQPPAAAAATAAAAAATAAAIAANAANAAEQMDNSSSATGAGQHAQTRSSASDLPPRPEPIAIESCERGDPTMDTPVMGTVGNPRNLAEYHQFELWAQWTEEHKSFADKITDRFCQKEQPNEALGLEEDDPKTSGHKFVILPGSPFFLGWSFLFMVVITYEVIMFPMMVFGFALEGIYLVLSVSSTAFWTLDVIVSFFVCYYTKTGHLQLNHTEIVKHYVRTWMVPDLIVIMMDWLTLSGVEERILQAFSVLRVGKVLRYLRLLRLLRVLRLRKLRETLQQMDEFINSQYFNIIRTIILNLIGILLSSHFIGCFWYWLGRSAPGSQAGWVVTYNFQNLAWEYCYLTSLHWSLTQFTPGSMDIQPQNTMERLCAVTVLMFGLIVFSSIVSNITAATNSLKNINARYNKQLWVMRRYFREQHISPELMSRVLRYADIVIKPKTRSVSQHEVEMLSMLPQSLYMNVMLEIYDQFLSVHPLFKALLQRNRVIMQLVCCCAVKEIVLAIGDELFTPGQIAHAMYFVVSGQLTYSQNHIDNIQILQTGSHFCEAVIWTPWVHQGTLVADVESELLAVDSGKFREVVGRFHADVWIMQKYGAEFVLRMNEKAGFFTNDPDDDVHLSDLLGVESATDVLRTHSVDRTSSVVSRRLSQS